MSNFYKIFFIFTIFLLSKNASAYNHFYSSKCDSLIVIDTITKYNKIKVGNKLIVRKQIEIIRRTIEDDKIEFLQPKSTILQSPIIENEKLEFREN